MSPAICDRLNLEPLPGQNLDANATPFTPYIDARTGITTGTSAFDRARTVQVAIADETTPTNPLTTYAKANERAEQDVLPLAENDFCVVVLRQATVYGYSPRTSHTPGP